MTKNKPIRVVIVDDQAIVRSGLAAFLYAYDELQLVGEANNGKEAIELCELVQPDVILMDLKMPEMDGLTATRIIRQRWAHIQILVLTSFKDKEMIQGALEAGATGYLLKNITAEELVEAIVQVHHGQRTVDQAASQSLVQAEHLDKLVEEIEKASQNPDGLSSVLGQHLPLVFPNCQVFIRIFPDHDLINRFDQTTYPLDASAWEWLQTASAPGTFQPGERVPWGSQEPVNRGLLLAPILTPSGGPAIGGISIIQPDTHNDVADLLPFVQTLAAQIATAVKEPVPEKGRSPGKLTVNDELVNAGKVQAGILPAQPPQLRGWEITAKLIPARETSGDFYDFIPVAERKLGIIIADVTDKGIGAALFMALSSTLLRTYAVQYPTLPGLVFSTVNQRILSDTRGGMFVTAFYGVLDLDTGRMRYVNAGHNPPYLFSGQRGKPFDRLNRTGMALGVDEGASWQQKVVKFSPGDTLVLYTDGITDAEDRHASYFGEQRLLDTARSKMGRPAQEIQDSLLREVYRFSGDAPQMDDITLLVVKRRN